MLPFNMWYPGTDTLYHNKYMRFGLNSIISRVPVTKRFGNISLLVTIYFDIHNGDINPSSFLCPKSYSLVLPTLWLVCLMFLHDLRELYVWRHSCELMLCAVSRCEST